MAEWETEHFPDENFVTAPAEPSEIADQLSPEGKAKLIAEALARYRMEDWEKRRRTFIWRLNLWERIWFP